jgi:hypothetical protein
LTTQLKFAIIEEWEKYNYASDYRLREGQKTDSATGTGYPTHHGTGERSRV